MIVTERIRDIMLKLDRGHFWGSDPANPNVINPESYRNTPQQINFNVVISAPNLHAFVMEQVSDVLGPGSKVLDIGSGTGILCAGFYEMVRDDKKDHGT